MTADETTAPANGSNEPEKQLNAPQPQGASPASAPLFAQSEKSDISHVLEGIKLPERRAFHATADIAKKPDEPDAAILEEHVVQAAKKPSGPASASEPNGERTPSSVVPVRTLKDDLQTVVREQNISLVHAVSLEEEKRKGQEHLTPEQTEIRARSSRRTKSILFAVGLLLVLGVAAIFGVIYVMQKQQAPAPAVSQSTILFAEQTVTLSLKNQSAQTLKAELSQARTQNLGSLGSITRVVPTVTATSSAGAATTQPATLSQFFAALNINPPQELMGAIGPQFFFGFHIVDTNAPLFVIPVTSYDHAFAGMLGWEITMDTDLSPIFNSVPMTMTSAGGLPVARTFQDTVMRNYDVRELTDDSGNIVLYYSFPTPNILVIAESPYSFTEILSRLQAEREL